MTKSKKIFFVSLALFCVSLFFFGIYNVAFKKPVASTVQPSQNKAIVEKKPDETSKISQSAISAITTEAVLAPVIADMDTLKYYSQKTGQVYQIGFDGSNKKIISNKILTGLTNVLWSPDKNKVITSFNLGGNADFYYYDYGTQKSSAIKKNVDAVAWQNTSNRIFYKYYDSKTKKRTLNISDPDGSNWLKLVDVDFRDVFIAQIPASGLISFWNKPDAFFPTALKTISLIGGDAKDIFTGVFGADYLWNNNGTNVLVSNSDSKGGTKIQLSVINENGGELKNLDTATLVSKCAWLSDNKNIICAVPGEIPANSVMPNDYDSGKIHTADTFWKIDTLTGKKTAVIDASKIDKNYDAINLFFNSDESILFFQDRIDGKLYRMAL
jgi:hypothetical protein